MNTLKKMTQGADIWKQHFGLFFFLKISLSYFFYLKLEAIYC